MKFAVLFSGGKDSCFACHKAMEKGEVACLVSLLSENPASYMFHTPNISLTEMQAEAIGLPLLKKATEGKKEEELADLKAALSEAKEKYGVDAVATGAVRSEYQSSRIEKICGELGLECFNPFWQIDLEKYMNDFLAAGFKAIISGVAAYPLGEEWLGRELDENTLEYLKKLNKEHKINIAGEGGEYETFVFDGPIFKKRVEIVKVSKTYANYSGIYKIERAELAEK